MARSGRALCASRSRPAVTEPDLPLRKTDATVACEAWTPHPDVFDDELVPVGPNLEDPDADPATRGPGDIDADLDAIVASSDNQHQHGNGRPHKGGVTPPSDGVRASRTPSPPPHASPGPRRYDGLLPVALAFLAGLVIFAVATALLRGTDRRASTNSVRRPSSHAPLERPDAAARALATPARAARTAISQRRVRRAPRRCTWRHPRRRSRQQAAGPKRPLRRRPAKRRPGPSPPSEPSSTQSPAPQEAACSAPGDLGC